jgi:hypothetical protein
MRLFHSRPASQKFLGILFLLMGAWIPFAKVDAQAYRGYPLRKHSIALQFTTPIQHQGLYKFMNDDWRLDPLVTGEPDPDTRRNYKPGVNLMYLYRIRPNIRIGFRGGLGYRYTHETYYLHREDNNILSGLPQTYHVETDFLYKQYHGYVNPLIVFSEQIKRLELNLGTGLSYARFGRGDQYYDHYSYYYAENANQPPSYSRTEQTYDTDIGGGHGFGVNMFLGIDFALNPTFALGAQFDGYLHYLLFNETTTEESEYQTEHFHVIEKTEEPIDFRQVSASDIQPSIYFKVQLQ